MTVGVGTNPPFLDDELEKNIRVEDSFWVIEGDELHITLAKSLKGDLWTRVFMSKHLII